MKVVVGGVETPYQVVAITRQLLDRRVLPKAISYVSRYIEEVAVLVAPSVEAAAPGAARNIIDNWIIPQPEAARISRRAFVEVGLADLNGPDIEGYGKLLGHGWLLDQFTSEAIQAKPLSHNMSVFKTILDDGLILIGCQFDDFTAAAVPPIFRERNARRISQLEF